jgi:hypothetical protein
LKFTFQLSEDTEIGGAKLGNEGLHAEEPDDEELVAGGLDGGVSAELELHVESLAVMHLSLSAIHFLADQVLGGTGVGNEELGTEELEAEELDDEELVARGLDGGVTYQV